MQSRVRGKRTTRKIISLQEMKKAYTGNGAAQGKNQASQGNEASDGSEQKKLKKSLEENINLFKAEFKGDDSVIYRRFQNKSLKQAKCCIIFIDGMIDYKHLNEHVIEPVLHDDLEGMVNAGQLLDELLYKVLQANNVQQSQDLEQLAKVICYGDTVFLLDGYDTALIIETKGWQTRAITEPETGRVVRGPREGFTEFLITNISLIRRRIKNPKLKFKYMELGKQTRTQICISYIEGIAHESILNELERRLNSIDIDGVLDSGYIQELIRDEPFSPFQTVGYSERPDVIVAKMLEGRIAILVDGSPFVLTVPFIIIEGAQVNEDYYNNYMFGSFNRFLRVTAGIMTISIPSLFLAIVTYHQEMLPTPVLISISASLEGVPLPTSVSLLVMLIIFDVLREAGTRMPSAIGQAVNIVGTLVLGQAAVEARLVSAPVVIVTALAGITTLMLPTYHGPIVIIRLLLLIFTSFIGIYGYFFGMTLILLHLMSMRSFGVPYMMSITRIKDHDGQDTLIRVPWWSMTLRPKIIGVKNKIRQVSRYNRRSQPR